MAILAQRLASTDSILRAGILTPESACGEVISSYSPVRDQRFRPRSEFRRADFDPRGALAPLLGVQG
jgi:hypothetical protein